MFSNTSESISGLEPIDDQLRVIPKQANTNPQSQSTASSISRSKLGTEAGSPFSSRQNSTGPPRIKATRPQLLHVRNHESEDIDRFLSQCVDSQNRNKHPEPYQERAFNRQTFSTVDPRLSWTCDMSPEEYIRKQAEIEARPRRKALFGTRKSPATDQGRLNRLRSRENPRDCPPDPKIALLLQCLGLDGLTNFAYVVDTDGHPKWMRREDIGVDCRHQVHSIS